METLKAGCKAYYDTIFCGLVPCKVLTVYRSWSGIKARAKVTADCGAYKAGMLVEDFARQIVPRKSIGGKFGTIVKGYLIEVTE